ncbi:YraN family protein [Lysobacter sp. A3-1-A15]|uniref:YraN family protein n=1 Tax=Novilysobacter viscosus TaxID=3098602 RepID=UPI002ED8C5C8
MPSADPRDTGAAVEAAACAHLTQAGLREIARNVGYRFGELDLVMWDATAPANTLVFVEVRHRRGGAFGGGAVSVTREKRRRLVRAAQAFLQANARYADAACRFDVVEAAGDPSAPRLNWLRDAFRADDC